MGICSKICSIITTILFLPIAPFYLIFTCFSACWMNCTEGVCMKKKSLAGKTVLLTGSAMGIGRELALQLTDKAVGVLILWDFEDEKNQETAEMCREKGIPLVHCISVNLSSRDEIYEAARKTKELVRKIDIVINNAGIARGGSFLNKTDAEIELNIRVNTLAHCWIAKAFLPEFISRNQGHIVCVASAAGLFGCVEMSEYSCSKFGALGFQEALENECKVLNKDGIKFTTVCPGYVKTRLTTKENLEIAQSVLPHIEASDMAKSIIRSIELNQGILIKPKAFYALFAMKGCLPRPLMKNLLICLLWKRQFNENKAKNSAEKTATVHPDIQEPVDHVV